MEKNMSAKVFQSPLIGQILSIVEWTHLYLQGLLPGPLGQLLEQPNPMLHSVILLINPKAIGGTIGFMSLIGFCLDCEITAGVMKGHARAQPRGGCTSQGLLGDEVVVKLDFPLRKGPTHRGWWSWNKSWEHKNVVPCVLVYVFYLKHSEVKNYIYLTLLNIVYSAPKTVHGNGDTQYSLNGEMGRWIDGWRNMSVFNEIS